jgi:glutamyl-tRNA synthetase
VRNYLALLGWGTQDDTTVMSTEELIERFDLSGVGRSSAIFDEQKLRWLNGRFMRETDLDTYTEAVARFVGREPDEGLKAACAIAQEKAQTLAEVWPLIGFLFEEPETDEKAWRKVMKDGALPLLSEALEALRETDSFEPEELETALGRIVAEHDVKPGKLYQPIRVAITGTSVSPGIFESLAVLGRDRSLERIERAVQRLSMEPADGNRS